MKHLPPWLQGVPLPARPHTSTSRSSAFEAAEQEAVPDWLRSAGATGAPEGIASEWSPDTELLPPDHEQDYAGIPDWLRGLQGETHGAEVHAHTDETPTTSRISRPVGATDWLRSLGVEEQEEPAPFLDTEGEQEEAVEKIITGWLPDVVPDEDELEREIQEVEEHDLHHIQAQRPSKPAQDAFSEKEPIKPFEFDLSQEPEVASTSTSGLLPEWVASDVWTSAETEDLLPDLFSEIGKGTPQPAPTKGDVPDWLGGLGDEPTQPAPTKADVPDWLMGSESPTTNTTGQTLEEVPPWLSSGDSDSDASALSMSGDGGLPDWLQGADADVATVGESAVPLAKPSGGGGFGSWFDEEESPAPAALQGEKSDTQTRTGESSEFFGSADLPGWLRPSEPSKPVETVESRKVNWLASLAIQQEDEADGGETNEVMIAPAITLPRPTYPRSPARMEATDLLSRIVASPFPEAMPQTRPAAPSLMQKIGLDRVLYLVLFLALFVGMLAPSLTAGLRDTRMTVVPSAANNGSVYKKIQTLSEKDVVLIAYEWDMQRMGELVPLEEAVTQHLLQQKARIVLMSTDLQGTMISFNLRDRMQSAGYIGKGVDYVMLGYRPGGELALRAIAQNFRETLRSDFAGRDATQSALATNLETGQPRLNTIHDLSLIVVIANQATDVQGWMEQVHRVAPEVPIVLLLPSEVSPIVQPYLQQENTLYLIGKQGALSYQTQLNNTRDADQNAIAEESGHYHFATLVFILLAVVGAAARAIASSQQKKPRMESKRGKT